MLKTLRLQNFQSHQDTTIELDPHFNCIEGPGHTGKTSLARALNLLFYNQWDKSWVTFGASHCTVTGILTNGITLVRNKGTKINEYLVTYPDGRTQKFENFGTTVPEEIQKLTNIFIVNLPGGDKVKLNLHSQFDPSFLQSLTSSNKAKLFGKLSGLDILDAVNQQLNTDKRQTQTAIKSKEEELEHISQRLVSFVSLPDQRVKLEEIKIRLEVLQQQLLKLQELQSLKQQISNWKVNQSRVMEQIQRYSFVDQINLEQAVEKLDYLKSCSALQKRVIQWKTKQVDVQTKVKLLDDQLETVKDMYIVELKQSGKCPTCQTPITEECLQSVLAEL